MKALLFAVCVVFAFGGVSAQQTTWQPSPGHTQVQIWPGAVPDAQPVAGPQVAKTTGKEFLVAGRPAVGVSNVTRHTITVYLQWKEYGRCCRCLPWRGLSGAGHRSRRHGGL